MSLTSLCGLSYAAIFTMACLLQGCCARHTPAILDADTLTLYSLNGNIHPGTKEHPGNSAETFHDWVVLGKTDVDHLDDQKKLRKALESGIENNRGTVAGCFIPRHGIRAIKGTVITDYVICFECMQIQVHKEGKISSVLTTAQPQPVFDAYLKKKNVPLAR